MMKTPCRLLVRGSLLAITLFCACNSENTASSINADTTGPLQVETARVITQKLNLPLSIQGELIPYESVDIYAKTTGFVKSINVDRGSRVTRGEVLAQLEAPELAAQLAEAESKLATAQSQAASAQAKLAADLGTYQRLTEAAKTPGVVAGNDLDVAAKATDASRANVAAAQSSIKAAESARNSIAAVGGYLRITAPFDGVITDRNIHPGALVGPAGGSGSGIPMLRIQTLDRLRLVVAVPESSLTAIPTGTKVKFSVSAYPTETFQAPVARNSHAIDSKTRTMPVELDVTNSSGRLTPGMYCQVQWPGTRANPTHFVPPTAIATNQERTFVIRIPESGANSGKAEWVDVKTGANAGNLVEVFGDLKDGDRVVLRASDAIRPGTPITKMPVAANP